MGFNFGQIGTIIGDIVDTDKMDIGRRMEIINPDGSAGETRPEDPIYIDVPCYIDFGSIDNPDPKNIDTLPIINSITISCNIKVDLQNGDFIYAKRLDTKGNLLELYTGTIGSPITMQSRKSANMGVNQSI